MPPPLSIAMPAAPLPVTVTLVSASAPLVTPMPGKPAAGTPVLGDDPGGVQRQVGHAAGHQDALLAVALDHHVCAASVPAVRRMPRSESL